MKKRRKNERSEHSKAGPPIERDDLTCHARNVEASDALLEMLMDEALLGGHNRDPYACKASSETLPLKVARRLPETSLRSPMDY
jgi:hypothetical protein